MTPNIDEHIVMENLFFQGYKNIIFEPDGNIPPDILVNNKIAIEVRRLNENRKTDNGFSGLEQDEFQVYGLIRNLLRKVSDSKFEKSAFVFYDFKRPIPSNKEIKKFVNEVVNSHKRIMKEEKRYQYNENFGIEIFPSTSKLEQQFKYGGHSYGDKGGLVVGSIYKNLNFIIPEKEAKIKKYRNKYPEWWLAVVDKIGFGLSDIELKQLNKLPKIENFFDRILIVSPLNHKSYKFLYE